VGSEVGVNEGEDVVEGEGKTDAEGISLEVGLGVPVTMGRYRVALGAGEARPQAEAISTAIRDRMSRRVSRMIY
jgi:hypothetical protein